MKKTLLLLLIATFVIYLPAFAQEPTPSVLCDFSATVGGKTYHENDTVVVPSGTSVEFCVTLTTVGLVNSHGENRDITLGLRNIYFIFSDKKDRNNSYCESDMTAPLDGKAKVEVRVGKKISPPGEYELYMKYYGDFDQGGYPRFSGPVNPSSLGPITVVFE